MEARHRLERVVRLLVFVPRDWKAFRGFRHASEFEQLQTEPFELAEYAVERTDSSSRPRSSVSGPHFSDMSPGNASSVIGSNGAQLSR